MGVDLLSTYGPVVVEKLSTWQGIAGAVASLAIGYVAILILLPLIRRDKDKPTLLEIRTGAIPFNQVATAVDEYKKSYGESLDMCACNMLTL
jgi:hypothetical protein